MIGCSLDEVLVHATVLVQQPEASFQAMDEDPPLLVREALVVNAAKLVHQSNMAALGQKRAAVDDG